MILKEYRVLLPLSVDEFQRGQLFGVAEASKNETGGGEGVEVLKQEAFTRSDVRPGHTLTGTYTHKIYRLKSKLPWIVQKLLPDAAMVFEEECWNGYPYSKTVITNPGYMKENFYVIIETIHLEDAGNTENALNLSEEQLRNREVVVLDIYDDIYLNKKVDITPDTDPREFKSVTTGRGPLVEDWSKCTKPVMCAYKVVTAYFKWTGFQGRIERLMHSGYPRIFTKFHREVYCWLDRWHNLTMADIRELEEKTAACLKEQLQDERKRGICADEAVVAEAN